MKVAIIGSESTGGRLLARLLSVDDTLDIRHWSLPHGTRTEGTNYPIHELVEFAPEAVLVTVRGWEPTIASKVANHQPDRRLAEEEMQAGYERLFYHLPAFNWRFIVYEFLVTYPGIVMQGCWEMLGRPFQPVREDIYDGNAKWLVNGEDMNDRTTACPHTTSEHDPCPTCESFDDMDPNR